MKAGNGYQIIELDSNTIVVIKDADDASQSPAIIIGPKVFKYALVDEFIIGENIYAEHSTFGKNDKDSYGYFIINTKNNDVSEGLSDITFKHELTERGINFSGNWTYL